MKRIVLAFIAISIATTWSLAQWREGGKKVPDVAWSKHKGSFAAMLLLTSDPEGFMRAWEKPASPEYKPEITTVSSVKRGENLVGIVMFAGCTAAKTGNCDATADLVLKKPDGTIYAEHKGTEVWQEKPAPPPGHLQVSVANLGLKVELDDPLGEYRLIAVVRDNVARETLELESQFKVLPAESRAR